MGVLAVLITNARNKQLFRSNIKYEGMLKAGCSPSILLSYLINKHIVNNNVQTRPAITVHDTTAVCSARLVVREIPMRQCIHTCRPIYHLHSPAHTGNCGNIYVCLLPRRHQLPKKNTTAGGGMICPIGIVLRSQNGIKWMLPKWNKIDEP